jgi:hypothetical protein
VRDHLPKILLETGGDRVWTKLPERYLHWMMANRLASSIVYREGVDFLDDMEPKAVAELALRYLRKSAELQKLLDSIDESALPEREAVTRLLSRGGIRALLHES